MTRHRRYWLIPPFILLTALIVAAPTRQLVTAGPTNMEGEHEQIVFRGSTACGVERWAVKTGTDSDARRVDLSHPVSTNVTHLRSLPAPANLPVRNRIRPTEVTVFRVSANLIRFKQETDSDYHLVLSDTGGRTMIAEIPAPDCVGANSPFLSQIRSARAAFDRRYRVTPSWHRLTIAVTVTGVGFFDFKHGQSGVAPNAIELHPVLSITFGKTSASLASVPSLPPPPKNGSFSLRAWVSSVKRGSTLDATLYAKTLPGAQCTAAVVYSTGRYPRSFNGSTKQSGQDGMASWSWHEASKGSGGTATVTCAYGGQRKTVTASF